jgi:hypothetical protein
LFAIDDLNAKRSINDEEFRALRSNRIADSRNGRMAVDITSMTSKLLRLLPSLFADILL